MINKEKTLLYIVDNLSRSHGWSTYAYNIIHEAIRSGYCVHVVVERVYEIPIHGVHQYPILVSPLRLIWNPWRIFHQWIHVHKILNTVKPDIVHVISEPYMQIFSIPFLKYPKVVLTVHGTYSVLPLTMSRGFRRYISALLFKRALDVCERVICVSSATKKKFLDFAVDYPSEKVVIIYNAIVLKELPPKTMGEGNSDIYRIITVGEVKRRKGIHDTIRLFSAWAKLRKKKVVYDVVGNINESSDYVKMVRKIAQEFSSEHFSVVFRGKVTDEEKSRLLRSASLYVHLERVSEDSSDIEGFGIGIIEAASYGLPALVAEGSATAEAVSNKVSGLVVNLDEQYIYDSIDQLLVGQNFLPNLAVSWAQAHSLEVAFAKIDKEYSVIIRQK